MAVSIQRKAGVLLIAVSIAIPLSFDPGLTQKLGLPTDLVTIKSLTVSPDPPQPGKNLTVTVSGTVHQTIEASPSSILTGYLPNITFRMVHTLTS